MVPTTIASPSGNRSERRNSVVTGADRTADVRGKIGKDVK
jgi:hypothetical protein